MLASVHEQLMDIVLQLTWHPFVQCALHTARMDARVTDHTQSLYNCIVKVVFSFVMCQ